jgi:hypothetical protein
MFTQKIKKIVSKLALFSLLFSNFSQIILEIPNVSAEWYYEYRSLSSSSSYFTWSSVLKTYTWSFINT